MSVSTALVPIATKALAPIRAIGSSFSRGVKAFYGDDDGWMPRGGGGGYGGGWNDRYYGLPNTGLDYYSLVGDLWTNSAVQACLNLITGAFVEAPPCLKEKSPDGIRVPLADDPITTLLQNPNSEYDDTGMFGGVNIGFFGSGNAYLLIERNRRGEPIRLWYAPHFSVFPRRAKKFVTDENPSGLYYQYQQPNTQLQDLPKADVVHFRFGIDPRAPLLGLAPWASVYREVFTDSEAVNYMAQVLHNGGALGVVAAPNDSNVTFDTNEMRDKLETRTRGDKRNRILVLDFPLKLDKLNSSPQELALSTFNSLPESRICALVRLSPMAVGLEVGLANSTYSNMDAAMTGAWHHCLLPTERLYGRQMTKQLGSQLKVNGKPFDPATHTLGFDTSEVRALQEDKAALHTMWREDYKAQGIDRATFKRGIGQEPTPEDDDVYYVKQGAAVPNDAPVEGVAEA